MLSDQARGRLALRGVGIARIHVALRQAVEREQQVRARGDRRPVRSERVRDRGDVSRIVVVVADAHELGLPSGRRQRGLDAVVHGLGRRDRVLGVERKHRDARCAALAQAAERRRDRWIPVGHAGCDRGGRGQQRGEARLQFARQRQGVDEQR